MKPTKRRGSLLEINGALNRPTTKFGVDYRLLGACLFISIATFLFASKVLACLLLPFLTASGAWLTRQDPRMFHLWVLSFRLASLFDPGKR